MDASMSSKLTLKVPDGTSGGTMLNVRQNGIKYKVAVPEGLQPGDQFTADLGPHNEVGLQTLGSQRSSTQPDIVGFEDLE